MGHLISRVKQSEGRGGRDLKTLPNNGTKGRIGENRKGERIQALGPRPGPMDKFLEAEKVSTTLKETTTVIDVREGRRHRGRRGFGLQTRASLLHVFESGQAVVKERVGPKERIGGPVSTHLKIQAQGKKNEF